MWLEIALGLRRRNRTSFLLLCHLSVSLLHFLLFFLFYFTKANRRAVRNAGSLLLQWFYFLLHYLFKLKEQCGCFCFFSFAEVQFSSVQGSVKRPGKTHARLIIYCRVWL